MRRIHPQQWFCRLALAALLAMPMLASATTVRMQTSLGNIDIQLFDADAPLTVANFLNYVKSGAYVNSFPHRLVKSFVLQGGGFMFDNAAVVVKAIPANAPVKNEFSKKHSNIRGTIAMAKLGGNPDSATTHWFFNLVDNSANLDNQNGGFTVFGQVTTEGMKVVDAIAALQTANASGAVNAGGPAISPNLYALPVISPLLNNTIKTENLVIINGIYILDAQVPSWSATAAMPEWRYAHTATLLSNGKVLVAGSGNYLNNTAWRQLYGTALYDPATETWSATGAMPDIRGWHTATLLPSGKVLVAGGAYYANNTWHTLASALLYDPANGTWTATGSMPTARDGHTATRLANGKVLVVGGQDYVNNAWQNLSSAALYDPASGTWTAANNLPTARAFHTATLLPNGKVLVTGGGNEGANQYYANAVLYDPANGAWTSAGSMAVARLGHTASLLANGKVLVAGGKSPIGGTGQPVASAEIYDPTSGKWATTGSMMVARTSHAATVLPNGKVLVSGGNNNALLSTANADLYDPAAGAWVATTPLLTARYAHTATLLGNGKVLAAGGINYLSGSYLGNAELYTAGSGGSNNPDFVVTNVTLTPTSPAANANFTAAVTVKNQGNTAGNGGKLLVWTNLGMAPACGAGADQAKAVGMLNPGASVTLTFTGLQVATAGTKTFRAFADGNCDTFEGNENNNQLTLAYRAHGLQPDFVVSAITLSPASPKAHNYYTATVTIKNQGTAAANASYLDVWADEPNAQPCGADGNAWAAVGMLDVGASKTLSLNLLAGSSGAKTLRAFVDSWCDTAESNDDNNQSTKGYTVQ